MKTVKVNEISRYKDGGTICFEDSDGDFYFEDQRMGSETKGIIFDRYPSNDGAEILDIKLIVLN